MKNQEPKDWYKNAELLSSQIKRWSVRIEERIYDFCTFDQAYEFGVMYKSQNTIQYKAI